MAAKTTKRTMSDEHKASLAEGRNLSRAVKAYLEALEENRPKRGRKRTPDSVKNRLDKIAALLESADPLTRLKLIQERMDLQSELAQMGQTVDLSALEDGFVASAATYGERQGISYAAWRELGVSAELLKRAGISR